MNGLDEADVEVQQFFQENGGGFCIIGGLALVRWGQPRTTQDVDLSLWTGFGAEPAYVDALLGRLTGRLPDAREFALENRVLLAQATNGVPLDIALAAFPYEKRGIARASSFAFAPQVVLVTASAEDLVVLKAFAGPDQDWIDVRGILARQGAGLDWRSIFRGLGLLCELKEDRSSLERLQAMRD